MAQLNFWLRKIQIVDFFENYNESNISTNAKYNLSLATTDSFKSLVIESEDFYSNLATGHTIRSMHGKIQILQTLQ